MTDIVTRLRQYAEEDGKAWGVAAKSTPYGQAADTIAELLGALEPFAFIAKIAGEKQDDMHSEMVALKHCRRAAAAIAKARGETR